MPLASEEPRFGVGVRGLSFGGWAGAYDRFRPGYPDDLVRLILSDPRGREVKDVVDLGGGTGQLSRSLLRLGYVPTILEPDPRMCRVAQVAVRPASIVCGRAEEVPLRRHSEDAVIAAQMWHWVDVPSALDQLHRILRPGGKLGIVWNFRDETVPWVWRLAEAMGPASHRWFSQSGWYSESKGPRLDERFDLVDTFGARHLQVMTLDDLVGLAGTFSHSGTWAGADAEKFRGEVSALLPTGWEGTVELPYVTKAFLAIRR